MLLHSRMPRQRLQEPFWIALGGTPTPENRAPVYTRTRIQQNHDFALGWALKAVWDPLLVALDRSWEALGALLGAPGALLGALGAILGALGALLGALGALLGTLGAILRVFIRSFFVLCFGLRLGAS